MAGAVVNGLEPQRVMPSETNARLVKCHVLETRMIDANFGNMSAETVARADMSHMLGHARCTSAHGLCLLASAYADISHMLGHTMHDSTD